SIIGHVEDTLPQDAVCVIGAGIEGQQRGVSWKRGAKEPLKLHIHRLCRAQRPIVDLTEADAFRSLVTPLVVEVGTHRTHHERTASRQIQWHGDDALRG
ncbi:MAG: hypothetical protein ACK55Z_17290, partial [bacterium]